MQIADDYGELSKNGATCLQPPTRQ